MATKTKQEIDKEVMFNKIMPSLSKVAEVEDDEDEDDKDYGSVFNRLFDEAKDFDSDEKKEGDK